MIEIIMSLNSKVDVKETEDVARLAYDTESSFKHKSVYT